MTFNTRQCDILMLIYIYIHDLIVTVYVLAVHTTFQSCNVFLQCTGPTR